MDAEIIKAQLISPLQNHVCPASQGEVNQHPRIVAMYQRSPSILAAVFVICTSFAGASKAQVNKDALWEDNLSARELTVDRLIRNGSQPSCSELVRWHLFAHPDTHGLDVDTPFKCSALSIDYSSQVLSPGTTAYTAWDAGFWSQQQAQVQPACVFQPSTAEEVSNALLWARHTKCPFAVKSGGHAAFAGASNIADGLTIDLTRLNSLTLSPDSLIASVGPGNRWVDVYNWLEAYNLSVVGGRVSDIGVGGLTLGGM